MCSFKPEVKLKGPTRKVLKKKPTKSAATLKLLLLHLVLRALRVFQDFQDLRDLMDHQ